MSVYSCYTEINADAPRCNNYNRFGLALSVMTAAMGPACLVILGVVNFSNCKGEKFVPICVIGLGATTLFRLILYLFTRFWYWDFDERMPSWFWPIDTNICGNIITYLLNLLVLTWIGVGAAFTFDTGKESAKNCVKEFKTFCFYLYIYLFSAILIGLIYIFGHYVYKQILKYRLTQVGFYSN